jgi:hypothetical protein
MSHFSTAISTDLSQAPVQGPFDQVSQTFNGIEGLGPVTVGANGASQAIRTNSAAYSGVIGAASGAPTATTATTDTAWTFASRVNHVLLQNNTTANLQYEFDTTASAGSPILAPGATFVADLQVTAIHLYTAAAQNINGTVAGNIVLRGWV